MKKLVPTVLCAAFMLAGCIVAAPPPGYEVEVAPPLPAVIELGVEPYYFYGGYYYFYDHDNWRYSRGRSGPWTELPRSHWPKEIRHREREFRHEH